MKSLFFNLSANYSHRRAGLISNQLFVGDFIISTSADRLSGSETWSVKGGLSKGIGHSRMVCGFETYASFSSASSMRDNDVIPYRQGVAGIKPYFKGSILKWLSADYEAEYGFSRLSIKEMRNNSHSFHQKLFSSILPDDRLQFTVGAEHFLTRFPEGNVSNLVLLDASAVWRISDRTRLSLTADNLLNRRSYEYVTYGTLSRSDHYFRLRPLTLLLSLQSRF